MRPSARFPTAGWSTYGQVARLTGQCTARMVGYAMAGLESDTDVPWHRVINAKGEISPRAGMGAEHSGSACWRRGFASTNRAASISAATGFSPSPQRCRRRL